MCDFSRVSAWFCDEKISLKKSCFYLYIRRNHEPCGNSSDPSGRTASIRITSQPLQATGDPYDPFALQKACLLACGIIPREGHTLGEILERLDYICSQRIKHGKMPADPVMIKTIVTMDMGEQIAAHYGLRTVNVLTGFKFIGEQIGKLEQLGKADSYVFGFEESYGYLTGSYVRDKDGVDGAYMICEMFSYYATQGISLLDRLDELYKTYGYCLNTLHSYEFDGSAGFARMQSIMQAFRGGIREFGGKKVVRLLDYVQGLDGLPKFFCIA